MDKYHFVQTQSAIVISTVTMSTLTKYQKLLLVKSYYKAGERPTSAIKAFHTAYNAYQRSDSWKVNTRSKKRITLNGAHHVTYPCAYRVFLERSRCFIFQSLEKFNLDATLKNKRHKNPGLSHTVNTNENIQKN